MRTIVPRLSFITFYAAYDGGKTKYTGHVGIYWGDIVLLVSKKPPIVSCARVEVLAVMAMKISVLGG
jgi:hypothetical protein